jgi:hypothetical protein
MSESYPTQRFDALLEAMLTKPPHELLGPVEDGETDKGDDGED